MKEKISRIEERLRTVKNLDEFKQGLLSFCKIAVNTFDLEMCTVHLEESNPIFSSFAISFPVEDHEKDEINRSELPQAKALSKSILIPIKFKTKRIGSIILVQKSTTPLKEMSIDRLNLSADKISGIIKKIIDLEIKVRLAMIIQRLISYKKKIGSGREKNYRIIFELLSFIISPTRVYISVQLDDGSYVFYNVLSKNGKTADISHGILKDPQYEVFMIEVKKDEQWTTEIDLKDHGRIKGKMMVKYDNCGSFVDDDIEKILQTIGYNFARLVIFNYFEKTVQGEVLGDMSRN